MKAPRRFSAPRSTCSCPPAAAAASSKTSRKFKSQISFLQNTTFYYMSHPAGDIYCFSLRVCPSVRLAVRLAVRLSVTLSLSEPYLPEPVVHICFYKSTNNIFTEVVQQKIKILFCQKLLKFWPKNTL